MEDHVRTPIFGLLAAAAVTLAACGGGGGGDGVRAIKVVGSSTVYPFTRAVAENFARNNPDFGSPVVESTGTGGGMELFCSGVGTEHPDIANASRRMKVTEFENCQANGVDNIIELQVGIDGLAVVAAPDGPSFSLTRAQIYQALAAEPWGEAQTAETWTDIDPSLPNVPIRVYGPPSTSGTRDAFIELIMETGCATNPAVEEMDEERKDEVCTSIREDQAFIEAGENDNLIIQRVNQNPGYLGLLGYSYLEENEGQVVGVPVDGVAPTYESIASFEYPGARPLFIYIKGNHLDAIRGLREFVAEYVSAWGPDGYLVGEGMIANPEDVRERYAAIAEAMTPLTAADFEN
ncbi:substrate-binding domain-containing protein [Parasphingopyxis sp. GrpM-11]|uniref:Substrate-binding domain-containing protein n=1 Tax=Parasphingopyxis marina TaxID=2761622 RepID=A0A842HSD9_9SPHN|nr:substrate-binding domain-containing protein [Parasphingopyxis marina]